MLERYGTRMVEVVDSACSIQGGRPICCLVCRRLDLLFIIIFQSHDCLNGKLIKQFFLQIGNSSVVMGT